MKSKTRLYEWGTSNPSTFRLVSAEFVKAYFLIFHSAPSSPRSIRCRSRRSHPSAAQLPLNCHKYLLLRKQPIISAVWQAETRAASVHWSDLCMLPPHVSFRGPAGQSKALIHGEYEMWELWLFNIIPPAWRSWWSRLGRTFKVFFSLQLCALYSEPSTPWKAPLGLFNVNFTFHYFSLLCPLCSSILQIANNPKFYSRHFARHWYYSMSIICVSALQMWKSLLLDWRAWLLDIRHWLRLHPAPCSCLQSIRFSRRQ